MIRIAGKNINDKKQARFALTPIKGIGKTNVKVLLAKLSINPASKLSELSEEALTKLRNTIDADFLIESELNKVVVSNIKHMIDLKTYRGSRHSKRLPVRGQTTKTNSRTVRGNKRNTGGSGKIKDKK
jgi:small subunit ribosomal protein S13